MKEIERERERGTERERERGTERERERERRRESESERQTDRQREIGRREQAIKLKAFEKFVGMFNGILYHFRKLIPAGLMCTRAEDQFVEERLQL